MRTLLAIALACALVFGPGLAGADDARAARVHFEQGTALYEAGDYQLALAEFEAAYRAKPHPTVLRNIAATQEALRRYGDAIRTLEQYMREATSSALRAERISLEQHLAALGNLVGRLVVDAPPGAAVRIDGTPVGVAPFQEPFVLPHGQHTVDATLEGHDPVEEGVDVPARGEVRVELRPAARMARLTIDTSAPRAMVSIDDAPPARAPWSGPLMAGRHRVRVSAPGRRTAGLVVDLGPGTERSMVVPLEGGGPEGLLAVRARRVRGAAAWLDAQPFPLEWTEPRTIEQGSHRLRVTAPDRVPYEALVRIRANRLTRVDVQLERDRFWLPPVWGLSAGGAAVAIAGLATYWGVRAIDAANQFHDSTTPMGRLQGLRDDNEQFAFAATFASVAAVVMAVGSALLLYCSLGGEPTSDATRDDAPIED